MDTSKLSINGMNMKSVLYRYTKQHHIYLENGKSFIKAKVDPKELIDDNYDHHSVVNAYKVGQGLSFCQTPHNYHKAEDRVCIVVKLKDISDQGGRLYRELSSSTPDAWFVTIPEGQIEVEEINH